MEATQEKIVDNQQRQGCRMKACLGRTEAMVKISQEEVKSTVSSIQEKIQDNQERWQRPGVVKKK
jgi:hypothetical protein